jgi:hypothetical protein
MKTNSTLIPASTLITPCEEYDKSTERYIEYYKKLKDQPLDKNGEIGLDYETFIDIPYYGKILRIEVSEYATIELLDSVSYGKKGAHNGT